MVVQAWCCNIKKLLSCFVRQFAISFHTLLRMTLPFVGPWGHVRVRFPWTRQLSYSSSRYSGSEHALVIVYNFFACLTFWLNATQVNMVKEWCRLSHINVFHKYLPHWINVLILFSHFLILSTYKDMFFSGVCNVRHSFQSFSHLIFYFIRKILLRHYPWRKFSESASSW